MNSKISSLSDPSSNDEFFSKGIQPYSQENKASSCLKYLCV